jgi:tetratricopeptide (TPR) repeat protein
MTRCGLWNRCARRPSSSWDRITRGSSRSTSTSRGAGWPRANTPVSLRLYEEIERRIRRAHGDDSALVAIVLRDRGLLERSQGRSAAAVPLLREALSSEIEAEGSRHFRVPSFRRALADALADSGQFADAEHLLQESVALLPNPTVYPHVELARTLTSLARALRLEGRRGEARTTIGQAFDIIRRTAGEDSREMDSAAAEARTIDPEGASNHRPGPGAS